MWLLVGHLSILTPFSPLSRVTKAAYVGFREYKLSETR
jgi:hypothetical protein